MTSSATHEHVIVGWCIDILMFKWPFNGAVHWVALHLAMAFIHVWCVGQSARQLHVDAASGNGGYARRAGCSNPLSVGNAIPDLFANPGISGLSLLNPGIPGFIPGLNRARLWLAIAGLVGLIGKIATTRTTRYRLNCAMHIVIRRLSCTFLHWRMVLFSVYCKSTVLFYV